MKSVLLVAVLCLAFSNNASARLFKRVSVYKERVVQKQCSVLHGKKVCTNRVER